MSIRSAIYDLLNDYEADVYPLVAPQETTDPYVVFFIRREPIRTQDGVTVNEITLTLNIYAKELDDALSLASTLYTGLEGQSGTYDSETLDVCNWTFEDGDYIESLDKFLITQEYNLKFL